MNIDFSKKPFSCLKSIKEQLIDKKQEYETRLTVVKTMYDKSLTCKSKSRLSNRFDNLTYKLKVINRRINLLEGEQK